MDAFRDYVAELTRQMESGAIQDYVDPGDPADLGDPLTQDEIDFVKKMKKEIEERFIVL